MTAIDPFTSVRVPTPQQKTDAKANESQFGKDTFLKLLVAQLKYQNPLQPTDSSQFLAQTAQFTMVEKLEEIEKQNANAANANQVLAAASMIGKSVTWKPTTDTKAAATDKVTVGGNLSADAPVGTTVDATTEIYTSAGKKVPLRLTFSRVEATEGSAWSMHVYSDNVELGSGTTVTFDANGERTSPDVGVLTTALDNIPGTAGTWPKGGIVFKAGDISDASRLRVGSGASTFDVREQNGGDGSAFTGIVTAIKVDPTNGALLHIGDKDVPLSNITDIHVPRI
jgi:flagellar basal-body rod modification protein FlgD